MSTVEIILLVVMLAAVFVGLTAAAVMVGQRPSFWIGVIIAIARRAWPSVKAYVTKRMTPAQEAELQQATRRAQEWDNFRKRPRDR